MPMTIDSTERTTKPIVRAIVAVFPLSVWLVTTNVLADSDEKALTGMWQTFERQVRDGLIDKQAARAQLPFVMEQIRKVATDYQYEKNQKWVFPIKGYGVESVGGNNGDGFKPDIVYGRSPTKGYDFFDGNNHGGHPAHDIFIRDKNQDTLDDKTGKPVECISVVDSLVLSVDNDWKPDSPLRGGNVVWLYNPNLEMVFYFAHLEEVLVKPSDFVKAGQALGTVGRTGASAYEKRSPTHLHLMGLRYDSGILNPINFYDRVAQAP